MPRAVWLVLPLVATLAACPLTTDATDRVAVTLSADRVVAVAGTTVAVTVTVVNRSSRDVLTPDPRSYSCYPPYTVRDDADRAVTPPGRLCLLILYAQLTLAPGDSIVIRDQWATNRSDMAGGAEPVDPGHYTIAARVAVGTRELASTPVSVEVMAAGGAVTVR